MYKRRLWSVRHSRLLTTTYRVVEFVLRLLHPLIRLIGYQRLDGLFLAIERPIKQFFFDSQSCGQCVVSFTGSSCPMNCPKQMRNGPCGGVRPGGFCEVVPDMPCVWALAWQGNKRLRGKELPIQVLQPPIDHRYIGSSAWLRELRHRTGRPEPVELASGAHE